MKHQRFALAILACAAVAALWPADAAAQRRGRPVRVRPAVVVASPFYYGYYGYYDPFFWGYPGWYPYGFYAPYYRAAFYSQNMGSARLQVTPKQAEVYVDGYFAGTVDDFDGFLQRLDVPAGAHEITLYLEGYRTIRQKVLFRPGATLKISYALERLGQGETAEPRPQPEPGEASASRARPPERYAPPPSPRRQPQSGFGTLAIRFQPRDAVLLVDGEEWSSSGGSAPLTIELGEGSHDVEVRKEGFTPYRTSVRVRAGETVTLNVSLSR